MISSQCKNANIVNFILAVQFEIVRTNEVYYLNIQCLQRRNHMECQAERQAKHQVAAAASPMQVYGHASLDTPNQLQIHSQILTL